jgi:hypothetical protein
MITVAGAGIWLNRTRDDWTAPLETERRTLVRSINVIVRV